MSKVFDVYFLLAAWALESSMVSKVFDVYAQGLENSMVSKVFDVYFSRLHGSGKLRCPRCLMCIFVGCARPGKLLGVQGV